MVFFLIVATTAVVFRSGTFIVYEGSQVVITQFGKLIGETYETPGMYFRVPLIQRAPFRSSTGASKPIGFRPVKTSRIKNPPKTKPAAALSQRFVSL